MDSIKQGFWILSITISLALLGCDDKENQARMLLNEAMLAWTEQDTQQALDKLDQVIKNYPDTRAATEAIEKRERLEGGYRGLYSDATNAAVNKHDFAAAVWRSVLAYKQVHGNYPAALVETDIAQDSAVAPFLTECSYEHAPRNLGVKLDCRTANVAVMQHFAETGNLAQYIDAERNKPQSTTKPSKENITLADFPLAKTTWGETLNPSGQIPAQGYRAFYINTKQPQKVIAQADMPAIALDYVYDQFHNIPAQDFGAYWVGDLLIPKAGTYRFALDQSWAKSRIILDKHVIYEGDQYSEPPLLYLQPGKYRLQFEYINNWHTVNVQLNVLPDSAILDNQAVFKLIQDLHLPAQTEVYVVGTYGSGNSDNHITVHTGHPQKPFILILGSYDAVRWQIAGAQPAAVIYNNADNGSVIASDVRTQIAWQGRIPHSFIRDANSCSCTAGNFYCKNNATPLHMAAQVSKQLTGFKLSGVSAGYNSKSLIVPEILVNAASLAAEREYEKARQEQKQACIEEADPDFERIMRTARG